MLTVSQTYWCLALTRILMDDDSVRQESLEAFEQKSYKDLNKLAALVRQELPQVNLFRFISFLFNFSMFVACSRCLSSIDYY